MRSLLDLYGELNGIYGYDVQIRAALHHWQQHLRRIYENSNSEARNGQDKRLFFGRGEPNNPDASYQYVRSFRELIVESEKDGFNATVHGRSVIVLTYAIWEEKYRNMIAEECNLSCKNDVESEAFSDLNKYRQAILHADGRLDRDASSIGIFRRGDFISPDEEQMYNLFSTLIDELNRIGLVYYGSSPGLVLDRPLNA